MNKRYNKAGVRMTDCCGTTSYYSMVDVMVCGDLYDGGSILRCKKCRNEVYIGEGDGLANREGFLTSDPLADVYSL